MLPTTDGQRRATTKHAKTKKKRWGGVDGCCWYVVGGCSLFEVGRFDALTL